jgi:hypothetical protein
MFAAPPDRSERHSTRWIAWMPLLFVSAFLYWSVALGLGGLSLMATSSLNHGCPMHRAGINAASIEPMPGELSGDPIIVHLQEAADVDDAQDEDALQVTMDPSDDDGTGRLPGHVE